MAFQHVGRPIKQLEDPTLITGSDRYVNDVRLANAPTFTFVRSPHAHGASFTPCAAAPARRPAGSAPN